MTEMVPKPVREQFRRLLWSKADALDWPRRPALEKAATYENWAKDKEIGGVLSHYMDSRKVRVYIKDTLMKPYERHRLHREFEAVSRALGIDANEDAVARYIQPPGRLLSDGRLICWGNIRDWKDVVFSVFERSWNDPKMSAHAAVLIANGKPIDPELRSVTGEAARRLGVDRLVWME
jgi:hypothetical protein